MREVSNFSAVYRRETCTVSFEMDGKQWSRNYNRYHPLFDQPTAKEIEWFFNKTVPYASPELYGWQILDNASCAY